MNEAITIPDPNTAVEVIIQSGEPAIVRSRMNLFSGQHLAKPVKPDDDNTGPKHRYDVGHPTALKQPGIHLIAEGIAAQSVPSNTDYDVWLEFYQGKNLIHRTQHMKGHFQGGTVLVPFQYNCTFK
jgi:hypothetical protein